MSETRRLILQSISASSPFQLEEKPITCSNDFISRFGKDVLTTSVLRLLIPDSAWKSLQKALKDPHRDIDPVTADQVANAMKEWALLKGASHFVHWFQPLTGATGEKHDSFLSYSRHDNQYILDFSGKELIKGESDASSFPSGGIRATFEARGYTIWDMSSPAFIRRGANGSSLYIPTAFCSWTGETLDTKTPLLRSESALNQQCVRILKLIGQEVDFIQTTLGPEQEFFLIDRGYFLNRPDLVSAGRTVIGAKQSKGQDIEHHYYGAIDRRVLACLQEVEKQLYYLGIPVKSRHNEVAPCQFEIAPIYEPSILSSDHNLIIMDILKDVASKHGLACLLHEKPFAGINGSGKHLNWSIETSQKENLLEPGQNPINNQRFLLFLAIILRALHTRGELLRAVVAVPGNSYRLGANEAPPVIISAFLGTELDLVCRHIMKSTQPSVDSPQTFLRFGASTLPPLLRDPTDRNRTSPFAFTGNKFEFRAVGSSQNIATPITVLNTLVAESVAYFADKIDASIKSGVPVKKAVTTLIASELTAHYSVVFNGNGYSKEWVEEAQKRGLPILRTAPEALAVWEKPENLELFAQFDVLTKSESLSRSNILHELFFEHLLVEARLTDELSSTKVLPSAITYQEKLSSSYTQALSILKDEKLLVQQKKNITYITQLIEGLILNNEELKKIIHNAEAESSKTGDFRLSLNNSYEPIMSTMPRVREYADKLEEVIDDNLWSLPKYSDIFLTSK